MHEAAPAASVLTAAVQSVAIAAASTFGHSSQRQQLGLLSLTALLQLLYYKIVLIKMYLLFLFSEALPTHPPHKFIKPSSVV